MSVICQQWWTITTMLQTGKQHINIALPIGSLTDFAEKWICCKVRAKKLKKNINKVAGEENEITDLFLVLTGSIQKNQEINIFRNLNIIKKYF